MTEFERIYEKNYTTVYRYILSLCRDPSLAEEIAQEAFVKALEHIDQFDGRCQLYVWICQIAKNTYYTHQKKQKRFVSNQPMQVYMEAGPEEQFLDKESAQRLYVEPVAPPMPSRPVRPPSRTMTSPGAGRSRRTL